MSMKCLNYISCIFFIIKTNRRSLSEGPLNSMKFVPLTHTAVITGQLFVLIMLPNRHLTNQSSASIQFCVRKKTYKYAHNRLTEQLRILIRSSSFIYPLSLKPKITNPLRENVRNTSLLYT